MTARTEPSAFMIEYLKPVPDRDLVNELSRRAFAEVGDAEALRLIEAARVTYGTDECEVDDNARFSGGPDGIWVSAWVWLRNTDTPETA